MRYMVRKILLVATIMLGWINMPAQAFLSPADQSLWPVMSQQFNIPKNHQADYQQQLNWDMHNRKYIHRLSVNAKPYLFYVYHETQKLHLPAELALLPMIESDYKPYGRSDVGATGLWQLMPRTASDFGIKMNAFYDGRRSTTVSTKAALDFLSYLYQEFNHNWLLALAAYNAGPGTVMEAIQYNKAHGKPTDFWALQLPEQTKHYIPKLLALATIIKHPHTYGVKLAPVPDKAVTSTVTIHKQMKLQTIAHLAHTTVHTVKKLNPALRRSVTPPHQVVTLVLPVNKKPVFVQHLKVQKEIHQEIAEKHLDHYTVQHGDSLSSIALKFKTTIAMLQKINQIHDGLIREHQAILVPKIFPETAKEILTATKSTPNKKKIAHHSTPEYHVKRGDNLGIIAHRFHTTRREIEALNHLNPRTPLRIGERLVVKKTVITAHKVTHKKIAHKKSMPKKNNIVAKKAMKTHMATHKQKTLSHEHTYIVKSGDNLHRLAAEFNTTTFHIMKHNHLKTAELSVGEHLELPNA